MQRNNKRLKFNSTHSDNPFDSKPPEKIDLSLKQPIITQEVSIDEKKFINFLSKKELKKEIKQKINLIYKKIRILSEKELKIESKDYYKFPFSTNIKQEYNPHFQEIYSHYINALNSVVTNYKKLDHSFYIIIKKEVIHFSNAILASKGLKDILIFHDISFTENNDELIIEKTDLIYVIDFIINLPVDTNFYIPLIISRYQFEYSIFYYTKIVKRPVIHCKDGIKYCYELDGHFISDDYKELFSYDVKSLVDI